MAHALRIGQPRSAVLALNVEDLDLPNKQAKITAKGGDIMWITWGTDTAHLLPRLIAGREHGPLLLSTHRPGPHSHATTDSRDICPDTGHVRLGYDRARVLLAHYGDGLRLHQLRHCSATHLGEANISANVIMAKTGHRSLRSVQRYVKPGLAAVHQATEAFPHPAAEGEPGGEFRRRTFVGSRQMK
ncbi:tyrosine-type recombinase/integrase [Nocardia tengchongensis]|uniref:tyrosine-type recombinase/integrase n=1 Tax=Nocardia tengchongensis TaxID=2055889 RepID=UPI0036A19D9E